MAPGIAADLAAVLLILLGLYGLAAAFAVFKHARHGRVISPSGVDQAVASAAAPCQGGRRQGSPARAVHAKAIVISGGQGNVTVVPRPPKITGLRPPSPVAGHPPKIPSLHQICRPRPSADFRPGPWYAALAGTGPNGYVPVLLAAFLFLAFGLWLVPRTLGMH